MIVKWTWSFASGRRPSAVPGLGTVAVDAPLGRTYTVANRQGVEDGDRRQAGWGKPCNRGRIGGVGGGPWPGCEAPRRNCRPWMSWQRFKRLWPGWHRWVPCSKACGGLLGRTYRPRRNQRTSSSAEICGAGREWVRLGAWSAEDRRPPGARCRPLCHLSPQAHLVY